MHVQRLGRRVAGCGLSRRVQLVADVLSTWHEAVNRHEAFPELSSPPR